MSGASEWEEFLTPSEAAAKAKRSVRTLARMRAEGRGPRYHKEGSRILYPIGGLAEWLANHVIVPVREKQ